jgi:hypothetical protein
MSEVVQKVKTKLKGKEKDVDLSDEAALQRYKDKEQKKFERKEEYKNRGLSDKTKFGIGPGEMKFGA